uniref:Replication factor C large subunit n=1 Tax=Nucleocytoviricota sp. TaxID=2809609 RepID=A0A9E8G637_9VIRU|nr:putative replication factor C large subunit [Nucleocytoviricota sp.]UZT29157.1 putative replication factor C large subunit [Nucleocytoviricota sp.]
MNKNDYELNNVLNRNKTKENIIDILKNFNNQENEKKGIFIYGSNGSGKTTFVKNILKESDMDYIYYDGTDIRSSNFIETLYENNSSNMNVISLFNKRPKTIVIIIDDVDSINSSDKSTLNNLIKLVRQKKTKKQKQEHRTNSPVIFIGSKDSEKKILELMKVCDVFKVDSPSEIQTKNIFNNYINNDKVLIYIDKLIKYTDFNFHKIFNIINIINDKDFDIELIDELLENISIYKNVKNITKNIINHKYNYKNNIISENDRTIVGLLYHENIIDILDSNNNDHINLYHEFLGNYCKTDFIDRIIYQKQIWQLNDLNFIIKILKNNNIINKSKHENKLIKNINCKDEDVRFTKILTKYSTEYNNTTFLNNICNELGYNVKDTFNYFLYLFENYQDNEIIDFLENYNISELDINRIKKILNYHYVY